MPEQDDLLTEKIIGFAIEVHRRLGPGLLEAAYEECLCYELGANGLVFKRQVPLPVVYKSVQLDCGYRIDIVVENHVIIELKTAERLLPIHEAEQDTNRSPAQFQYRGAEGWDQTANAVTPLTASPSHCEKFFWERQNG